MKKTKAVKKLPTRAEVKAARAAIGNSFGYREQDAALDDWQGQGWSISDLYVGIRIGLEIARQRTEKEQAE